MPYDPTIFNINPYYDDYDPQRGFLRVLFKPGYALQAREVTQLQSILQNQLGGVADHLFKDGARISGGALTIKNAYYLMFKTDTLVGGASNSLAGVSDYSYLLDGYLQSGSTVAKVLHYIRPDSQSDNRLILVVDFVSGSSFENAASVVWNQGDSEADDEIAVTIAPQQLFLENSSDAASVSRGNCKLVSIAEGLFYVDGFFVYNEEQNFSPYRVLDYTDPTPATASPFSTGKVRDLSFSGFSGLNMKVGFSVNRDNVTDQEDSTLRDPAIGSYNYNAPGADRYKIVLSLDQRDVESEDPNFVELLKFEDGRVTKKVERIAYGDIEKALAIRTYDESGSYTVNQNEIRIQEGSVDNTLSLQIGSGKSYVLGHELENNHTVYLDLPKARDVDYKQAEGNTYPFSLTYYTGVTTSTAFGETFGKFLGRATNGYARVIYYNESNTPVFVGRYHGLIPSNNPLMGTGVGRLGRNYRMYLAGFSGSIGLGRSAAISTLALEYTGLCGGTLAQMATAAISTRMVNSPTDARTLVYPIRPGTAISDITSLRVLTKLTSGTDIGTPEYVPTVIDGTTASYVVSKANFAEALDGLPDSAWSFLSYPNIGGPNSSASFGQLSFVWAGAGTSAGLAFTPNGTSALLNNIIYDNKNAIQFSMAASLFPSGFTGGTVDKPIRAIVPVVYTPSIPQDEFTVPTDFRYKVLTDFTYTVQSSVASQDTNVNLSNSYGGQRRSYSIGHIDVYSITRITGVSGTTRIDITDDFELDGGQRDFYYGAARILVKESEDGKSMYNNAPMQIEVIGKRFAHNGPRCAPFIGKYSYLHKDNPGFKYENIPLFSGQSGRIPTVSLANCVDFRRSNTADVQMIKPYGRAEFSSEGDTAIQYKHWLPRIDKVCVKENPQDGSPLFYTITGEPDTAPVPPADPDDGLVLATLTLPAYTHSADDVLVTPVDNKRYTMSDIAKIKNRVNEVEVFTKLSLSEQQVSSQSLKRIVTDPEPVKTSILVDEFYGHSIGDVSDNSHRCSIDYERGILYPFFRTEVVDPFVPSSLNGVTLTKDGLLMLNYTEKEHISHKKFTRRLKINPSNTVNWLGFMELSKSVIPYYDQSYRPVVKTNALMENDNWLSSNANNDRGFGTQFNEWQSIWTGIEQIEEEEDSIQKGMLELPRSNNSSSVPSYLSGNERYGVSRKTESVDQKIDRQIRASRLKNRIKQTVGNRVVDRSVVPYIPYTAGITATVHGLKPSAQGLVLYVDGTPVVTGISTDIRGSCAVRFGISAGTFLTGKKTVRISDSPIVENSTIAAEAVLHCTGLLEQKSSGVHSTRPYELRRQTTDSEAVAKDPYNRNIDIVDGLQWTDPLSQTFFVDKKTNPGGIFVSSISLYFSHKDARLPVTLQIRPTVGGYPSPSVVIPFSTVTKIPTQVTVNSTSPQATVFKFSSPVYLEPGEYAICLNTNSNKYRVFAADSSRNGATPSTSGGDVVETGRAGNNQLVGTLYYPQGTGIAVQNKVTDLMFVVNRCNFAFNSSNSAQFTPSGQFIGAQAMHLYAPEIIPQNCSLTRTCGSPQIGTRRFINNDTFYFGGTRATPTNGDPVISYGFSRGSDNATSPVVDVSAAYCAGIKMFTALQPNLSTYVSRIVELPEGYESNGLAILSSVRDPRVIGYPGPYNSQSLNGVEFYYRVCEPGEEDIYSKPWVKFPVRVKPADLEKTYSESELDYVEHLYRTVNSVPAGFNKYQIRVDLKSERPDWSMVPSVKNIRVMSFLT